MVFAVEGFVEAVRPGVAVIPVEVPRYGEEVVERGGVRNVPDEGVDPGFVCFEPRWVKGANYRGGVDEVAVTELVSTSI